MIQKSVIFACDIGGSKLLCGFVDDAGGIIDRETVALSPDITTTILESHLEDLYQMLCRRNPNCTPIACGVTIPGLADEKNGVWVYACFSGISDYPIARRLQEMLHLPVYIENDVNACALAERIYGGCRDCKDYLWVTVSNGVGGGLILNGEIYRGSFGGAGEFGHVVVEDNGPVCPCGHKGCMEAVAAGPAISKRYEALTGKKIPAKEIFQLACGGDAHAKDVVKKTGEYLGKGLGKAASLLNLERYVLGGGVMQSFDILQADIMEAFQKEAFAHPNRRAQIIPTALGYHAGLLGAAAVARVSINL